MALKVVTLDELKAQMREDFDGEDALITLYGEAAEQAVIGATRRSFKELCRMGYYEQNGEYPPEESVPEEDTPSEEPLPVDELEGETPEEVLPDEETPEEVPSDPIPEKAWFPSRLKVAILMLAAHSHRNREPVAAVAQNAVPYAFDMYIKPYVKLSEREV